MSPHRAPSTEKRYWAKVDTSGGPDACWPWTGTKPKGYGRFWDGTYMPSGRGRYVHVTRWAWAEYIGPIPDGMFICHTCDNPSCCNQRHHFLGTPADNVADRDRKGRTASPAGVQNAASKLTPEQVAKIRERYAAGAISQSALAAEFGVCQTNVSHIIRGATWTSAA